MKTLLQQLMIIITIFFQYQMQAQPVDTPDYPITSQVNIDQYNPSVFVNPWNPDEVINANIQFTHTVQGQIVSFAIQPADCFHSLNAGTNWSGNGLPASCNTQNYPAVQINHNGRYYVNYGDQNTGIYLAWSDNKGATWQQKLLRTKPDKPFYYVTNNNFWIDNSRRSMHRGNVYAVWRFIAYEAHDYCIEFCSSDYGSEEWSNPVNICGNEPTNGTFEEWPVVQTGPFGEIYTCWMNHKNGPGTGETSLGFNYSYDGGKTFGVNYNVIDDIKGLSGYQNLIGLSLISAPSMAVDISGGPYDGKIYIVWANVGVPGINTGQDVDICLIASDSQGSNWSEPVKVNQDAPGLSKEHFMPAITCDPETGTLTVIYYDNRNLGSNMAEVWGSVSYDGAVSFTDFRISDIAMNRTNLLSIENGDYLSEKICVSSANGKVYPVWADFMDQFCRTVTSPFNEKPVSKPDDLNAQIAGWNTGTVSLTWTMDYPAGVLHYNIYRNNQFITTTSGLDYQDNLPEYGNYSYRVTAQFTGIESSPETAFVAWGQGNFSANRNTFDVQLMPENQTTYVLKIENDGTLPVDYTMAIEHDPAAGNNKDNGPDTFGYQWIDSNNPGGPGFDYTDISTTGTEITGIANDNYVGPFPMGFSFPFYENFYQEFYISSNGLITFDGSFSNPVNSPIPIADGNNNFIAWCWDDLQKKTGGQVYYQHFDNYTIVQFKDYAQNGNLSVRYMINAEVLLYKNGDILIQYLDFTPVLFQTNSCTIGIENHNGTDGLQVVYNQLYIEEKLAIRFFNPGVKWMTIGLPYGTVEPGTEEIILVDFNSLGLPFGNYYANLVFKTFGSDNNELIIPSKLEVKSTVLAKPTGLNYTASGNDIELYWTSPPSKGLIGYNVYESGEKITTATITQTTYQIEDLLPGGYFYQVTALYSEGESNPEGNPLFVFLTPTGQQNVQITNGWSGISSYIVPADPDIETVLEDLSGELVLLIGTEGIFWPGQNINTIGNWNNQEGYKVKLLQPHNLEITGNEMAVASVYCNEGWNIIPVLSKCEISPGEIFAYGLNNLVIIKEIAGTGIYWPSMGIFTLESLIPGKAYEMFLTGSATLYFPECSGNGKSGGRLNQRLEIPWNTPVPTAYSHTIAIKEFAVQQLMPGDIIGAFSESGICSGTIRIDSSPVAISVFADDTSTAETEGMSVNEPIHFKLFRPSENLEYEMDILFSGDMPQQGVFTNNGLSAIESISLTVLGALQPESQAGFEIYPNPSNGQVRIDIKNAATTDKIIISTAMGQIIHEQMLTKSIVHVDYDLANLPDGIYLVYLTGKSGNSLRKMIISK